MSTGPPIFTSAFPIISTADLIRALDFYRDALGGALTYQFPADGTPVFVTLTIGASEVGLAEDSAASEPAARFALWFYADDCDAAVAHLSARGATIVEPPADQPWGERVAKVLDPDGNVLLIGSAAARREEA